jgi:hypothetical protein
MPIICWEGRSPTTVGVTRWHLSRVSVRFKRRRKAVSSLSLFTLRLSRSHYMYMQPNKRMPATATLSHTHAHAHKRHAVTYVTVTVTRRMRIVAYARPTRIRSTYAHTQSLPIRPILSNQNTLFRASSWQRKRLSLTLMTLCHATDAKTDATSS